MERDIFAKNKYFTKLTDKQLRAELEREASTTTQSRTELAARLGVAPYFDRLKAELKARKCSAQ